MQSHTPLTLLRAHGWPPHENVAICHCQHLDSILTMNMNSMSHMNVNVIYVHINEAPSSTSCSSCVCVVDVERGRSQRLAHGSSFTSVTLAPPAPPPGQQSFSYLEILLEIWARARARVRQKFRRNSGGRPRFVFRDAYRSFRETFVDQIRTKDESPIRAKCAAIRKGEGRKLIC